MIKLVVFLGILVGMPAMAQDQNDITLDGIVTDRITKEVLMGASIYISGTSIGTQSDLSGRFSLIVPPSRFNDSLSVTYIGYKKYTESLSNLKNRTGIQISLINEPTTLKEVVVHSQFWLKEYSSEELTEDYTKFCTLMEKVHTGLYDYISEQEWHALKDSSLQLCKYPLTHSEFYHLIALHVGKVRNMHTRHGVTDKWYKKKQNIFPFNVTYFEDKLYITESLVDGLSFSRGTEILEINGRTPTQIKRMIWPYIPADGYNQTGRFAELNDFFPWFFALFVEETETYHIKLITHSGEEVDITSAGLRDSFAKLSFRQLSKWKKSALELQIDYGLKTAYLRIEDSRMFKDSIQTYFQRINDTGMQNLIIDLRGRGGIREEEQVAELYSYLVEKPFIVYERTEVKSNDYTLFDKDFTFKPYANSLKEIKQEFFDKLTDSGKGDYLWEQEFHSKPIKPAKISFTGTIYILVDGRNYSASTDFTTLASQLNNVVIVGEETGGEYRSYISGAMFKLTLPNSKIGVKIPTWKSVMAIDEKPSNRGRGVMPDYPVTMSFDDFTSGNDVAKDYVYKLIVDGKH